MASRYLRTFGGTIEKMQYLPDMPSNVKSSREAYNESMKFDNGGGDEYRTFQGQQIMEMDFPYQLASGAAGLDLFARYRNGRYGPTPFYLNHPATFGTNVIPPAWASPRLIEQGWQNFGPATPIFAATPANSYDQPGRYATWNQNMLTEPANSIPTGSGRSIVIPIPPTYTLWLGASGLVLASAGAVLMHNAALTVSSLTTLDHTASTRLNASVDGSTTPYVRLWVGRTANTLATLSLVSLMAQLWPTGVTPPLTGNFVDGEGNTGWEFADSAVPEVYGALNLKSLHLQLKEVGAWRK